MFFDYLMQIVLGHGLIGGKEILGANMRYWEFVDKWTQASHRNGVDPIIAAYAVSRTSEFRDNFGNWPVPERLVFNFMRTYDHLDGRGNSRLGKGDLLKRFIAMASLAHKDTMMDASPQCMKLTRKK